jgi:hypothetical protein
MAARHASSLLLPLALLPQLLALASACHRTKAAYYTSPLTLTGTEEGPALCFWIDWANRLWLLILIGCCCGRRFLRVRRCGRDLQRRLPRRGRARAVPRRRRLRGVLPGTALSSRSTRKQSTPSPQFVSNGSIPERRSGARTRSSAPRRARGWSSRTAPGPTAPTSCSAARLSRPWRALAWRRSSPSCEQSTSSTRGTNQTAN